MRIVSFYRDEQTRLGILRDETILDATSAASMLPLEQQPYFRDALSFIRGGDSAMLVAERLIEQTPTQHLLGMGDVKLAPPMMPSASGPP